MRERKRIEKQTKIKCLDIIQIWMILIIIPSYFTPGGHILKSFCFSNSKFCTIHLISMQLVFICSSIYFRLTQINKKCKTLNYMCINGGFRIIKFFLLLLIYYGK